LDASTSIALGSSSLTISGTGGLAFNHTGGSSFLAGLSVGSDDDQSGGISIYGAAAGAEGGELRIYYTGDHDTVSDYFAIDAISDDIRFFREDDFHEYLRFTGEGDSAFINGNVGIGTANPLRLLDINGDGVDTGTGNADFRIVGSGGGGAGIEL